MRRLSAPCLAALALLPLAAACGTAWAYLTASGSGSASAGVTTLEAPTLSATPGGEAVALSWSAVGAPGPGTVTYAISRDGGAPAGDCPSPSSPGSATSCTDSPVSIGSHTYTVTARWHSWSVAGAPVKAYVASGPATEFLLTADSSTPTAGSADNLTVTAKDATDRTVTSYTGPHSLTFSGPEASPDGTSPTVTDSSGTAVELGSPTTLSFSEGTATVSGVRNGAMSLYKAGPASIGATDGSISTLSDVAVTVTPATAASLSLAAASITPLIFDAGVATASETANGAMTLYAAQPASIAASAGPISTTTGLEVTAEPGPAARLAFANLQVSAGTVEPNCLFVCAIAGLGRNGTVVANVAVTDEFGNVVNDLGSGHRVQVSSTSGSLRRGRLRIARTGPAESTRQFTFTARGKASSYTITAESSQGTTYSTATATVVR
jgi:hypothetical protein